MLYFPCVGFVNQEATVVKGYVGAWTPIAAFLCALTLHAVSNSPLPPSALRPAQALTCPITGLPCPKEVAFPITFTTIEAGPGEFLCQCAGAPQACSPLSKRCTESWFEFPENRCGERFPEFEGHTCCGTKATPFTKFFFGSCRCLLVQAAPAVFECLCVPGKLKMAGPQLTVFVNVACK